MSARAQFPDEQTERGEFARQPDDFRDWVRADAAHRTGRFIVEDLQWIDASTLEFLNQFVLASQRDAILTLLTFRPDFKTPWPAGANQTTLALTPLTRKEVTALLHGASSRRCHPRSSISSAIEPAASRFSSRSSRSW